VLAQFTNKMKIKTIKSQSRRDFEAIYECEHCGATVTSSGYDDDNFHRNVIPNMTCKKCGKKASDEYRPLATKYAANEVV
jgi:transcription elongation factor Elf1